MQELLLQGDTAVVLRREGGRAGRPGLLLLSVTYVRSHARGRGQLSARRWGWVCAGGGAAQTAGADRLGRACRKASSGQVQNGGRPCQAREGGRPRPHWRWGWPAPLAERLLRGLLQLCAFLLVPGVARVLLRLLATGQHHQGQQLCIPALFQGRMQALRMLLLLLLLVVLVLALLPLLPLDLAGHGPQMVAFIRTHRRVVHAAKPLQPPRGRLHRHILGATHRKPPRTEMHCIPPEHPALTSCLNIYRRNMSFRLSQRHHIPQNSVQTAKRLEDNRDSHCAPPAVSCWAAQHWHLRWSFEWGSACGGALRVRARGGGGPHGAPLTRRRRRCLAHGGALGTGCGQWGGSPGSPPLQKALKPGHRAASALQGAAWLGISTRLRSQGSV